MPNQQILDSATNMWYFVEPADLSDDMDGHLGMSDEDLEGFFSELDSLLSAFEKEFFVFGPLLPNAESCALDIIRNVGQRFVRSYHHFHRRRI